MSSAENVIKVLNALVDTHIIQEFKTDNADRNKFLFYACIKHIVTCHLLQQQLQRTTACYYYCNS